MNKRLTFLVLGFIMLNLFNTKAQQITSTRALESARTFWGTSSSSPRTRTAMMPASTVPMNLVYVGGDFARPDFYIYNVGENNGFVVVAGDERMHTILAYSTEGCFDLTTAPDGFMDLLQSYSKQTGEIRSGATVNTNQLLVRKAATTETLTDNVGTALLDEVSMEVTKQDGTKVTLKGIKYDQLAPYNALCPIINGARVYTGCGATAMVQVMRYFRYPSSGTGSHRNTSVANLPLVDFSKAVYQWDLMLPNYSNNQSKDNYGSVENRDAVALAMYHAGVATDMIYTSNGSGTGAWAVANALKTYFRYNPGIEIARKVIYTDDEWFALMKNELDNGRPVPYSGSGEMGGHFFVCDGYDNSGRLHYNYGWSGTYNAWAYPVVAPTEGGLLCKFPYGNDAVIGVNPTQIEVRPQLAQLSTLNVSNLTSKVNTVFNVSFRVSNYGRNTYKNKVKLALCKAGTDEIVTILKTSEGEDCDMNIVVPTNNYELGPDVIRYQEVVFTGVKIPTITNGTYDLKCFASSGNSYHPLLARNDYVQKVIKVTKKNDGTIAFSYALGNDEQMPIGVSKAMTIAIGNGIGKATINLKNTDVDYEFAGNVFVIGYKDDTPTMELFGSTEVVVGPGATKEIVIPSMRMKSGKYTYFVAYNPMDNADGLWLGAVPIKESKFVFEVPAERVDAAVDFAQLTRLPEAYRQYHENTEYISETPENDQEAAWVYNTFPKYKAVSVVRADRNRLINTLITDAFDIEDENGVLEWQLSPMGGDYEEPIPFDVYVSTTGNSLEDFTEESLLCRDSIAVGDGLHVMRESLYKYAGKKIYIAFKHRLNNSGVQSMLVFQKLRILNIASPHDIALNKVEVPAREVVGEPLPITITVNNQAPFPITDFTATYTVAGESFTEEFTHKGIPYDTPTQFTLTKAKVVGNPGDNLDVKVTLSMAGEDKNLLNDNTGSTTCKVMSFHPHQTVVVYKVSRGACGACMVTYAHLDAMEESFPDSFSGIELWEPWSGQPTYPQYGCSDFQAFYSASTPSITANNRNVDFYTTDQMIPGVQTRLTSGNPVSQTKVEASYVSADSRTIKIKLTSRFALPMTGVYKMGIFVIESNVKADGFQILNANLVAGGHTKNHMPIAAPQGAKGEHSTYTVENPVEDKDYVYEFTYDVPENHGDESGIRTVNKENIQVIGVMFNPNGTIDSSSLNSYYVRIPKTEGLTFVAEQGYVPFKEILEVKETMLNIGHFVSSRQTRSTVMAGEDFRFHIEKDATVVGNKKVRLIVKKSRLEAATLLIPDANGIYTLKNVNRYYFFDVEIADDAEEPTVTREGTSLILKGTWDSVDFGRILPVDNSITSIDMSAITIPADAPQITPANPNCLLYVAPNSTVPAGWKNVVKGTEAEEISLTDGYAFYNIKEFTAAKISYSRTCLQTGWSSLYLPFGVPELPAGINLESFVASTDSEVRFKPLQAASTMANTPYLAEITSCDTKVFNATDVQVKESDVTGCVEQGSFIFRGTCSTLSGEAISDLLYVLDSSDDSGFIKADNTNSVPAFRAYLEAKESNTVLKVEIKHGDDKPVSVKNTLSENSFRAYSSQGKLFIIVGKETNVGIFTMDGRKVKTVNLHKGENIIEGLNIGLYLVNNHKVSVQ
ncbi:C10 family peptidase [Bacteroides sp.]